MNKNRRNWILAGVLTVAIVAGIWMVRRPHEEEKLQAETPVVEASTAMVQVEPFTSLSMNDGTITARLSSTLSPKIMSTVTDVLVREGQKVNRGQVLVRLEARDLQASVAQARAAASAAESSAQSATTAAEMQARASAADVETAQSAVKEARAHLDRVRSGARRQELAQADLAVEQAKAQLDLASSEANRMRALYEQDVVTLQRLEQAQAAERTARAAWEAARQQAELMQEGSRSEEIRAAEERVAQAEAQLRAAKASQLAAKVRREQARAAADQTRQARAGVQAAEAMASYSTIRAPFSGVVTRRLVDPGDQVGPGSQVIEIEDRSAWTVEADIPENQAVGLSEGDTAVAAIDALNVRREATIVEIRPGGDPGTRTVHVKARIESSGGLKSGMFARLMLPQGSRSAVSVPTDAILDPEGMARVWVVGPEGQAQLRLVTLGEGAMGRTIVLSGLEAGDRIVVSNLDAVSEGARIARAN